MIDEILRFIKFYLNNYLETYETYNIDIELGRLGNDVQNNKQCSLLITLLHIEEERSLKVQNQYVIGADGRYTGETKSPEIMLNLYVAISSKDENYETSLRLISYVISAFQSRSHFDCQELHDEGFKIFSDVNVNMHPMNLNEANNLWESLSEQRIPFVVYKINSLMVTSKKKDNVVKPIGKDKVVIESEQIDKINHKREKQ